MSRSIARGIGFLRLTNLRSLRKHPLRAALAILTVASGVAIIVAIIAPRRNNRSSDSDDEQTGNQRQQRRRIFVPQSTAECPYPGARKVRVS